MHCFRFAEANIAFLTCVDFHFVIVQVQYYKRAAISIEYVFLILLKTKKEIPV